MFCKIFTAAKTFLDVVACKIKHFTTFLHPRTRRAKSTAILHVTTAYLEALFDPENSFANALA